MYLLKLKDLKQKKLVEGNGFLNTCTVHHNKLMYKSCIIFRIKNLLVYKFTTSSSSLLTDSVDSVKNVFLLRRYLNTWLILIGSSCSISIISDSETPKESENIS